MPAPVMDPAAPPHPMEHHHHHPIPKLSPLGWVLYLAGYSLFAVMFRVVWRRRVIGLQNLPRKGAVLLAANHRSNADPPVAGSSLPRIIHFMAKEELFRIPVLGWFIRRVNAFPVKRWERDVGAFKTAQRLLEEGEALILFPEGTRQRGGRFGNPKPGVGMLAAKTGCPVVPVYIHNSDRLASFSRLTVVFGKPMKAAPDADYAAFSREVMDAIRLLKETYFGPGN